MYQTISQRKKLIQRLAGLDLKNNLVKKRNEPRYFQRLLLISFILLLIERALS